MFKKLFERITGLDQVREETAKAEQLLQDAINATAAAQQATHLAEEQAELAKLSPKERATRKNEPWVGVLQTHVNKENVRNGFFELDWNDLFVLKLKQEGYGFEGDPDEEIVDRWFRDLCRDILADEGQDINRGAGYINVVPISQGKSEVS
jgi:hypothetical protein